MMTPISKQGDLSPVRPLIRDLKPSATLVINERSRQLIEEGHQIYRLGFGQSPFPVPPTVVKALQKYAGEKDYLPVKGLPALRKAVADFNQRTLGLQCTAEEVIIGPGSKELIFNLQLAYDGVLLLPAPNWVSYEPQAQIAQMPVYRIPTTQEESWRLQADDLEKSCQELPATNKLLILNYPNNPTGISYSPDHLKSLAQVLRKHQVLVIADEIYGEVHHTGNHHSLAEFYPEGTIISGGLSKWCGAGGWRLGTFTFPPAYRWLQDAMARIASETFSAVSAPIQYAACTAFAGNEEIEHYLKASRKILKTVGQFVYRSLTASGIQMPAPEGGFYLFPNFTRFRPTLAQKGITTSAALCEYLLTEKKIALLPGSDFGRPESELTARLAFVDFDGQKILEHFAKASSVPTEEEILLDCPAIRSAVRLLAEWCAEHNYLR